jgi:hypothetical protein
MTLTPPLPEQFLYHCYQVLALLVIPISQLNIIYNVLQPSLLLLHILDKLTRSAFLILRQKIKWDIIYCWMNLPPSARQETNPQRLLAHLDSTFRRLCSYFQYIGLGKFANAIRILQKLQELNLAHV